MVAGHLQEKNGIYYVVLTYKTINTVDSLLDSDDRKSEGR